MNSNQNRNALRKQLRQQRNALDADTQYLHSIALVKHLSSCSLYRRSKNIAMYLATDGEIDTEFLIHDAWQRNKKVFLPVLAPFANRIYFAAFTPDTFLKPNKFGIAEPDVHPKHWLRPRQMNVILMPLVGFDPKGNRLGMGGGFYDRSLGFYAHRKQNHHPYLIGLAHQLQCVDQLASQPHDVPMCMVATEQKIYKTTL